MDTQPLVQVYRQEHEDMALAVLSMALHVQTWNVIFRQVLPVSAAAPGVKLALAYADLPTGGA